MDEDAAKSLADGLATLDIGNENRKRKSKKRKRWGEVSEFYFISIWDESKG